MIAASQVLRSTEFGLQTRSQIARHRDRNRLTRSKLDFPSLISNGKATREDGEPQRGFHRGLCAQSTQRGSATARQVGAPDALAGDYAHLRGSDQRQAAAAGHY